MMLVDLRTVSGPKCIPLVFAQDFSRHLEAQGNDPSPTLVPRHVPGDGRHSS